MRLKLQQFRQIVESERKKLSAEESKNVFRDQRGGDAIKQQPGPELSDLWYETKAAELIQTYGTGIDSGWEEKAVNNYCNAMRATSHVEIDREKLSNTLHDMIKSNDDETLESSSLKELASLLFAGSDSLNENFEHKDATDPVASLLKSNFSPAAYVQNANKLFAIKQATISSSIKKHRLGENALLPSTVPVKARLTHGEAIRAIDERALDTYCENWNARQALVGEPLKIDWYPHPSECGIIGFKVTLK